MTKLEAVNLLLRACGDPPVTALDTGGTSDEGEAETILDQQSIIVQRGGWAPNVRKNIELALPDRTVSSTTGTGTFTFNEVITQETTLAKGYFKYEASGVIYMVHISGTWNDTDDINGATASRDLTTATAAITSAKHAAPESAYLSVNASCRYPVRKLAAYGGFLYDVVNNTTTFTENVFVDAVALLAWTDVPDWLQQYIVQAAAMEYQRYKKRGTTDERLILERLGDARARARQMDQDLRRFSMTPAYSRTASNPLPIW